MADDIRIESLTDRIDDLERTVYGNNREKINGGGIVGEVRRLKADFDLLRAQTIRPPGWSSLIVIGGVASLLLHLITLAALVAMLAALNGG